MLLFYSDIRAVIHPQTGTFTNRGEQAIVSLFRILSMSLSLSFSPSFSLTFFLSLSTSLFLSLCLNLPVRILPTILNTITTLGAEVPASTEPES